MKRILAMLLCFLMLLSVVGCGAEEAKESATQAPAETAGQKTPAEEEETEEDEKTEEKETEEKGEVVYDKVSDPLTPERVAQIPIANSSMTTEQLRQICVDYVRLSVSFQWVPNQDFVAHATQQGGTDMPFYEGKLHGGIPYVNVASGNVYRILEYYDTETGVLDVKWLAKNPLLFGTACSGTTDWGWHRVINSAKLSWTANMTQKNGLIKVGPYEYDPEIYRFGEEGSLDCKDIAKANGEQIMYQSYAESKMADCFVNNGHVRMNGKDPVVVYNEDGTIDGKKSYIVQVEQGLFTTGEYHKRVSADGVEYKIQGNEGKMGDGSDFYYTFEQLYSNGYLPHTFKEFHGLDPVEKAEVKFDYEGDTFVAQTGTFSGKKITANYVLSHVVTTITDAEGNQALRYVKLIHPHYLYSADIQDAVPVAGMAKYREGGYKMKVEVQLGNGERLVAYEGTIA